MTAAYGICTTLQTPSNLSWSPSSVLAVPSCCSHHCLGRSWALRHATNSSSLSRAPLKLAVQRSRHSPCTAALPSDAHVASLNCKGKKFGVVVARFNDIVTKLLLEGALDAFRRHGDAEVEIFWVPGSFELPLVAKSMAKSGSFDAVLTIGAVIRGATTHYEAVVNSAVGGTLSASMDTGVPVIFGVLTTETMEQAMDRAGGKAGNKGYECAVTVIEMANLMQDLKDRGLGASAW